MTASSVLCLPPNSVDTGSIRASDSKLGLLVVRHPSIASWSTFPPGPRILAPSPLEGVHAISPLVDGSLRLDLACFLLLGFCERFLGSTRQRYLINAQSPCPGLLGCSMYVSSYSRQFAVSGSLNLASLSPNLVYLLLVFSCIYL